MNTITALKKARTLLGPTARVWITYGSINPELAIYSIGTWNTTNPDCPALRTKSSGKTWEEAFAWLRSHGCN